MRLLRRETEEVTEEIRGVRDLESRQHMGEK